MERDYYALLHLTPAATFDEVHKAYRSLAMQYHPDRNPTPDAASAMVAINEAYAVLSEPSRRRQYDQERGSAEPFDIAGPILRAAHETLLKQGWGVVQSNDTMVLLEHDAEHDARMVRVTFATRAESALMKKIARQFAGFSVVMAVEIETPFNLAFNIAVIDLLHSRHIGAPFPDAIYRSLFAAFVT